MRKDNKNHDNPATEILEPTETTAAEESPSLTEEMEAEHERYLRLAAEYDNYRKRTQKERDGLFRLAVCSAIEALLPVHDNLERAVAAETTDETYKRGVEMIYAGLRESFEKLGVTEIEAAAGTPFNPELHNAVLHVEDESLPANCIADVFQKGFALGDAVIRHTVCKTAN